MLLIYIKILFFLGIFNYCESWNCNSDHENKEIALKNKLLCHEMDAEERPPNENGTLVRIKLYIKSFDYSDTNAELTIHSWLGMSWFDSRLKWNPDEFNGLSRLVVEENDIWFPQLAVFNSPTTQFEENCASTPCHLASSGQVSCIPSCTHHTFCKTDFTNWPFDIQNCTFHMGSWMHSSKEVKFVEQQTSIEKSAIKHNEFKIIKIKIRNNIGKYKGVNQSFPSIHYNIVLERHATAEMAFIFAPAMVLAILNMAVLWLSPNCGERLFITVLTMLLHFIILQNLSYIIPKNADTVPVALIYFRDSLLIALVVVLETIICRSLLLCRQSSSPRIKAFTDTLRGYKVGQFMFENPYLINRGTNMKGTSEPLSNDSANLVDNEAGHKAEEAIENPANSENIWFYTVKILDMLLFLILVLCYIVMIIGWFPDVRSSYLDEKTVDVINNTLT